MNDLSASGVETTDFAPIQPAAEAQPAPGASPLNAFVAALADQVFQRVTAGLAANVKAIVDERLSVAMADYGSPTERSEAAITESIRLLIDEKVSEAISDYDPTQHMDFDTAVETVVDNWIDRNLDISDAVGDALRDIDLADKIDIDSLAEKVVNNDEFESGVKGVVESMTFEVTAS